MNKRDGPNGSAKSVEVAFGFEKLGNENRAASSAAHGVVREANKFVIKNEIVAQAAGGHGHAVSEVAIELGLRAVVFFKILHKRCGRAGEFELLRQRAPFFPGGKNFVACGLVCKLHKHRGHVAVAHGQSGSRGASCILIRRMLALLSRVMA
jgi:hypothetical protein